jgi:hypothetical protein
MLNPKRISASDRRKLAVHEAGHAVIALHLGYDPDVAIWYTGSDDPLTEKAWLGQTRMSMPPTTPVEHHRMIGVAGMVAEDIWANRHAWDAYADPWYWEDTLWDPDCMSPTDWRLCGYADGEFDNYLTDTAAEVARLLTGELWPNLIATSRWLITEARQRGSSWPSSGSLRRAASPTRRRR